MGLIGISIGYCLPKEKKFYDIIKRSFILGSVYAVTFGTSNYWYVIISKDILIGSIQFVLIIFAEFIIVVYLSNINHKAKR